MTRTRKEKQQIAALVILALLALWLATLLAGCQQALGPDGVVIDANAPPLIEPIIETGISLAQLLGAIWPPLIPIATAAGGIYAGYKRLKPKLQEAQVAKDKYRAAGETLTEVLEGIKIHEPDLWAKIGPKIQAATSSSAVTALENTIRKFRGLYAKPELSQGV